jgi:hypothetical protein
MKLIGNIVAIVVLVIGALWMLQGLNVIGGTGMSGQSQWLWTGIVLIVVALAGLWWINRGRSRMRAR